MLNYESAKKTLPEGNRINPRRVWVVYTWPYLESAAHAALFDQTKDFAADPNTIFNTFNGIYAKPEPIYYCASDRPRRRSLALPWELRHQLGPDSDSLPQPHSRRWSVRSVCPL